MTTVKSKLKRPPKKVVKKDSATKLEKLRPKRKTVPADSIIVKPGEEEEFVVKFLSDKGMYAIPHPANQCAAPITIEGQIKTILDALNRLNGKAQNETIAKVLKTVKDQRTKEIDGINANLITATKALQEKQESDGVFDCILKGQYEKLQFLD